MLSGYLSVNLISKSMCVVNIYIVSLYVLLGLLMILKAILFWLNGLWSWITDKRSQ